MIMEEPERNIPQEQDVKPMRIPSKSRFSGFLKSLLLLLLLVALILGSFWISFNLGKRLLVPVKKPAPARIEVPIPEPPPSLAGLQRIEDLTKEAKPVAKPAAKPAAKAPVSAKVCAPQKPCQYYKVQAGFFVNKDNALNLAKKLQSNGFGTFLKKFKNGWRVQVGAFSSKARALQLQKSLKAKGFDSTLIYE
jgi:hypothetical protein